MNNVPQKYITSEQLVDSFNWVKKALSDIKEALTLFGAYNYGDKGPEEVMDVGKLSMELRTFEPELAALCLNILNKETIDGTMPNAPAMLAETLLGYLQDWDPLWEGKSGELIGEINW